MKNGLIFTRCLTGAIAFAMTSVAFAAADSVNIEAAQKEGKVAWYSSTPIKRAQQISTDFEKKYGIKVELFRSGGSAIVSRFGQELAAGHKGADVVTASDVTAFEQFVKKGAFIRFNPEGYEHVPASLRSPEGYYIAQRLNVISFYVRTDLVPASDRPKTWESLLDPKYKGKMVMPNPSFSAQPLSVVGTLATLKGWDYFKKLSANDVMVVKGNQQVVDMVNKGERPIAISADQSYGIVSAAQGHPVEIITPTDGTFIISAPTGVVKGSEHPEAAKLLAQFMITKDVQNYLSSQGDYPSRDDIDPPKGSLRLKDMKIIPVDFNYLKKSSQQIKQTFNMTFLQ